MREDLVGCKELLFALLFLCDFGISSEICGEELVRFFLGDDAAGFDFLANRL